MQMREFLNNNPVIVAIAAIVFLGIALTVVYKQIAGPSQRSGDYQAYYLDRNTGSVFTANANLYSPIEAPSGPLADDGGPAGVRAIVFACGECGNEEDRFVAYVEMYPEEIKQQLEDMKSQQGQGQGPSGGGGGPPQFMQMDMLMMNKFISAWDADNPTDFRWVHTNAPEGVEIMKRIREPCEDRARPKPCRPGKP